MSEGEGRGGSPGNVPFSWEKKAGVSKSKPVSSVGVERDLLFLPPPPSTQHANPKVWVQDCSIPLPPCAFQPPYYRTSSKKGLWITHDLQDPFMAAFKECTKTRTNKTFLSFFSCKRSCAVRDQHSFGYRT